MSIATYDERASEQCPDQGTERDERLLEERYEVRVRRRGIPSREHSELKVAKGRARYPHAGRGGRLMFDGSIPVLSTGKRH